MARLFLSPPDVGEAERELLLDAFDSNWIAPLGPHVDAFEKEMAAACGVEHAVALSSGTAALHLALIAAGVGPGDEVIVPTLTFAATANAVTYVGAEPVFVDCDQATWTLDPGLLAEGLDNGRAKGPLPAAVITVDLYGQCCDYDKIAAACEPLGIPIIEDAAEALGATYQHKPAGAFGMAGVLSFNGNKIITTSGGGMLTTDDESTASRVRYLATQARQPALHYEHTDIGFNYRMSNLLAAVGRGQLRSLAGKVARRREINARYRDLLGGLPGLSFMPLAPYGEPTCWLTVVTVDANAFGASRDDVIAVLEAEDIEARPAWKPMHLQPVFKGARTLGGATAERIFADGLCLPSGSSMSDTDVERVAELVASCRRG